MQQTDIMTLEEVAQYLKLQPQTIYKWAQEGQIPGAKLGKEWRFRRRILDEWIDSAIHLSKGGFNFLFESSLAAVGQKGLPREEIERILQDSLR
jgi:excisionase family DNA binding protein